MRETSSKVTLSGVPETMLQTVYARAKETQNRGAVRDEKAVEIIRRLDYDFSLADKDSAMSSGVIARTIVLDKLVKTYLSAHPGAVAVNIACGLDTRCYRMQGYQHWYNLDLPETIAVREKLLPENGKISQIAMSAMDDWGGMIRESGDALVIIEGLTMYLSEADVQRLAIRTILFWDSLCGTFSFGNRIISGRSESAFLSSCCTACSASANPATAPF